MRTWTLILAGSVAWMLACMGGTEAPSPPPEPVVAEPSTDTGADLPPPRDPGGTPTPRAIAGDPRSKLAAHFPPKPARPAGSSDNPRTDAPEPARGADKEPGTKPRGIRQTGKRSWTVTKSLFESWKDDPHKLGRIKEKGAGWETLQVRQRHAYHLGVRGKDVVLTVNGHKLDTNSQLMGAYLALQFKKKFDVEILRNGKKRVHHYEVVPD